jgi:hypothetical protein
MDAINQGITDLAEMAPCHHFASKALHILRSLAQKWNVAADFHNVKEFINDVERLTQTRANSGDFFVPNLVADDFLCTEVDNTVDFVETVSRLVIGVHEAENPLFWPFARQGRPKLLVEDLEKAGFTML